MSFATSIPTQKLLRHKGPQMTRRYAHHVREIITPAIQGLDAFYREAAECYKSVAFDENGKDENRRILVPKAGIEPARGVSPTGF